MKHRIAIINFITLIFTLLIVNIGISQPRERPEKWAIEIINSGLDNFHKIDNDVYRSKQPNKKTFAMLQEMGIKEVLNLRRYHSDTDEAEGTDIKLHHIKINSGSITEDHLIKALATIQDRKGPILFHCWHGSDRTGAVAAAYRIVFNGWSKAQAIDELVNGGYGYHAKIYGNIVELLENLDIDHVRFHLGLTESQDNQ